MLFDSVGSARLLGEQAFVVTDLLMVDDQSRHSKPSMFHQAEHFPSVVVFRGTPIPYCLAEEKQELQEMGVIRTLF